MTDIARSAVAHEHSEPLLAPESNLGAGADLLPTSSSTPAEPRAWLLWLSGVWLGGVIAGAILAGVLPLAPFDRAVGPPRLGPSWSKEFLGTDALGRSLLSRIVFGGRVSLFVCILSVTVGVLVGGLIGMMAGYFRGWVDAIFGIAIDSMLAIPALVLLLALTAMLRPSLPTLGIALAAITVPTFARLARANTLAVAQREFVAAARAMGASHRRVIAREILPNVALPVGSYAFLVLAVVIVAEGSLSFLSLGIPPPQPSWGGMIASGRDLLTTDPYLVFLPSGVLLLTVLSFNVVGDHMRRRFEGKSALG